MVDKLRMRQLRKNYRERHKLKGLCIDCANKTALGCVRCAVCFYNQSIQMKKYYLDNRDYIIKQVTLRRDRLLAEGKCPKCAALLIDDEIRYCASCRAFSHLPLSLV